MDSNKKNIKKIELEDGASAEIDDKNVRITQAGEQSGKSSLPLLEMISEKSGIPIYKGTPKHAYESDFLKYKDKCPRCQTATVNMNSNFAYATQEASRLMSTPAGHFCSKCPTVIIDDDIMRQAINGKYQYAGVFSVESGYDDEALFETFNGEKPIFIFDESKTNIYGIFQSVNRIDDDSLGYVIPPDSPLYKQTKKTKKTRKRNMSIKKSKRRNRKK